MAHLGHNVKHPRSVLHFVLGSGRLQLHRGILSQVEASAVHLSTLPLHTQSASTLAMRQQQLQLQMDKIALLKSDIAEAQGELRVCARMSRFCTAPVDL